MTRYLRSLLLLPLACVAAVSTSTTAPSTAPTTMPSSTRVEDLTSVSSRTIRNGLGFNIDVKSEWEFKMASEAGAIEVRFQPSWPSVENMAGVMRMSKAADAALDWCAKYGIQPLLVAAYGPPWKALSPFFVARDYPAGVTEIELKEPVKSIEVPYCHVMGRKNAQIVKPGKWAYYGALIAAVDATKNTITLAAATNAPLTAGEPLVINRLLYPSVATADPNDPSIFAYGKYAAFLASSIASHGIKGRVELWNEPGWLHDSWDHRGAFYEKPPADITTGSPNFGIAEHLAPTTMPDGVRYNWGGTNKSGARSVLNPTFMKPPLTAEEVANSIACEALHPYGNSPEDHLWDPTILASVDVHHHAQATLPGASTGSNMKTAAWLELQNPSLHLKHNISETGTITADNVRKARFALRQYLGFLSVGLERVTFFQFAAPKAMTDETFGFVDATTQVPTVAYTAIKSLVVTDMADLPTAPLDYKRSDLATVSSYTGTYPLTTMSIVGRHAESDTKNSFDFVAWQRSHTPPGPVTNLEVASTTKQVKLTWQPNTYSVDCTVERATTSGGPYEPIAEHTTRRDFTDKSVRAGTSYYYVVVGNNPAGMSSYSNEVTATPAESGAGTFNNESQPPGAPQTSWLQLASPPPGTVDVQLPEGYTATSACNLVSRVDVPIAISGHHVTYPVADDPVSLHVAPQAAH